MKDTKPKQAPRFGPEVWARRAGRDWSLWDLWFCVVAARDHDGDAATDDDSFRRATAIPNGDGA